MRIRDRLARTSRHAWIAAILCWLGVAASILLNGDREPPLVVFVFVVGFAAAVLFTMFRVKCPRCGFRLGMFGLVAFRESRFNKRAKRVNFCPHCGLDLDGEMES